MRGRKPKPSHLKVIAGNPGKRPLNGREPVFEAVLPEPPPHLSSDARAEWERVAPLLCAKGLLTAVDRAALAAYCQAYARWVQAEQALGAMGARDLVTGALMIKTTGGNAIQNPLVGIANRAEELMLRAAVEFGMTPSARTRVRADAGREDENAFARLAQ